MNELMICPLHGHADCLCSSIGEKNQSDIAIIGIAQEGRNSRDARLATLETHLADLKCTVGMVQEEIYRKDALIGKALAVLRKLEHTRWDSRALRWRCSECGTAQDVAHTKSCLLGDVISGLQASISATPAPEATPAPAEKPPELPLVGSSWTGKTPHDELVTMIVEKVESRRADPADVYVYCSNGAGRLVEFPLHYWQSLVREGKLWPTKTEL